MKEKIESALSGLKDFQRKTVDYVFDQLYKKGRDKMLIADEVGLGKTIVAKGIVAKAFERFQPSSERPVFNVIYVCSNQALARQNLAKLNFTGDPRAIDYNDADDRVTGLAYESPKEKNPYRFRIKAFTPATSFDDKTHAGRWDERILLYRLLYQYSDLADYQNSLQWILKGNNRISDETWEKKIRQAEYAGQGYDVGLLPIRSKVFSAFRNELNEQVSKDELPKCFATANISSTVRYWTLLRNLCQLGIRKNNYYNHNFSRELISSLRLRLSKVCLEFLHADIFILDEFQRYKQLINQANDEDEHVSPAIELAREIFSMENSKILMLSATPFKPFTNDFDEMNGEVHYNEFKTVLQFLLKGKRPSFWTDFERDRRAFFSFLRHPHQLTEQLPQALGLKGRLEELYRSCMVRTERLLASEDRGSLIKQINDKPITVRLEDIQDFVVFDQITQLLNNRYGTSLPVPLEYVKSSPYSLSFLDHYAHKEKIRELAANDSELRRLLRKTRHAWLNLTDIDDYKPLISRSGKTMPNAKLRLLLSETVEQGWRYLWVPPSIPYYKMEGAFAGSEGFSKALLFSSWKMVPRMVSSVVSYEAERYSVGNSKSISEKEKEEKRSYFQKRRSPRPQFTFKVEKDEKDPTQMNNFMLSYPSPFLASLYDPATNVLERRSINEIKKHVKTKLKEAFEEFDLNSHVNGRGDWQKWYWLAPLLLDLHSGHATALKEWFDKGFPASELNLDSESATLDREEHSGRARHFQYAKEIFGSNRLFSAARLNAAQVDQVCGYMADLVLGSPAICFLRSVQRHSELTLNEDSPIPLDAAFNIASAFLTMFNKPESIAVVRMHTDSQEYYQRVLQYSIDGNIQAMLDEFVYLLVNGENIQTTGALSDFISDVLSIRTASTEVDDLKTFIQNLSAEKKIRRSIRAHYAVDFGTQRVGTANGAGRQINIRQAFNSPFRPFVLASTSIGQEGLDFHLYCKKIFHWNLPSNPIDFEQREGRIHRYQGLVIRLNLADKYKEELRFSDSGLNVWKELFRIASQEKNRASFPCDLVPFWHTETRHEIKIERFVPLYPFSRDVAKFENLIKVLTFYRLTFGQPRQEELVDALHEFGFKDEDIKRLDELILNLTPMRFWKQSLPRFQKDDVVQ